MVLNCPRYVTKHFYCTYNNQNPKQWNAPIDETSAAYERTGSHLATQASAFSETCNVYAPYYRQATYFSFFDAEANNGCKALDLAYSDLSNAFEIFMEKHNNGKPFL